MRKRTVVLALTALLLLPAGEALADKCEGCACRGGPGYRDAKGQCVGHAQLYSRCGTPPTTRCTFEGASHVGKNAVPPEWTPAQHTQWLAERNAAKQIEGAVENAQPATSAAPSGKPALTVRPVSRTTPPGQSPPAQ